MTMTAIGRKTCEQFHADPPTVTRAKVDQLFAAGRITQEDLDCILDPECNCQWSTAASTAEAGTSTEV